MIQAVFIRVVLPLVFEVDTDSLGEYAVSSSEPKVDRNDESTHPFKIFISMFMATWCCNLANHNPLTAIKTK
jgi:hypothetical protein